ncbi:MAG: type I DNA topoisomerase [Candidatus Brocadiia bacterium]
MAKDKKKPKAKSKVKAAKKKKPVKLLEPVIAAEQPMDEPVKKKSGFKAREQKPFVPDKAPDDIAERSLVIVESPAKSKTIGKILGNKFFVSSCYGHIRDLPSNKLGLDIENDFAAKYEIIPKQVRNVSALKKMAKKARAVYIASDPDREGEAIAWHLTQALELPDAKTWRVSFDEITADAINRAFEHPTKLAMDKVNAQQARRFLDRVVGYKLSPLLWKKIARGLSAGRVQSVAVKLIVAREKEIKGFIPQEYWKFLGAFTPPLKPADVFEASLVKLENERLVSPAEDNNGIWLGNETESTKLIDALKTAKFTVVAVTEKETTQSPPPPFITSTLQQQAFNQLGFTTKKTMFVAQQLYEGVDLPEGPTGLITYMRTDSVRINENSIQQCRNYITTKYGADYLNPEVRRYKSGKSAQEAHEAIRPAYPEKSPDDLSQYLTPDQFKLYNLIWKRCIATQMAAPQWKSTSVEINSAIVSGLELELLRRDKEVITKVKSNISKAIFTASARKLLFKGYLTLYSPEEQVLLALKENDQLNLAGVTPTRVFTLPPPRYTEASLVKALEKYGIGRPSTYSPIISTIQARGYVYRPRRSRQMYATELGILVTDKLQKYFDDVMNTGFTAGMEEDLDKIEEAKAEWLKVLKDFYGLFSKDLAHAEQLMEKEKGGPAPDGSNCEKCGNPMIIRWSRHGRFIACSGFPKCRNVKPIQTAPPPEPVQPAEPEKEELAKDTGEAEE